MEDWGNFPVDLEQFVHGHLCDADRIFNGKSDVFGDFDKLTHESEVFGIFGTGNKRSVLARGMNVLVM